MMTRAWMGLAALTLLIAANAHAELPAGWSIDGPGDQILGFDNRESRPVTGTREWRLYEGVLDVPASATNIAFGFLLHGSGELWADGFRLEPVSGAVPLTVPDNGVRPLEPRNLNFSER